MSDPFDEVSIDFDTGGSFKLFTELTLTDTFLDPCQTMTCSIAADETRFDLLKVVKPGSFFTVRINGNPQCSGIVDSVAVDASRGGRVVSLTGRDFMSRVVDGNADPRIAIAKELPFADFCAKLFAHFNFPDVTFFEESDLGRNMAVGKSIKTKKQAGKRRRKFKDPAEGLRPKDNEGGFQWFIRIAHRLGYHAWIMPDGSGVVVGGPDYEQEAAYAFTSIRSEGLQGKGGANNILHASARLDITGLPSHVYVRGKGSKPGEAKAYTGFAQNKMAPVFKPFYLCDDESTTQAHADALAKFTLGKAQRNAQTYEITVRGSSDPVTGRIYNVDTVADVNDENCGVKGKMWVESRTFRYSRTSNTTTMRLIPADSLTMDYYVADAVPAFTEYDEAKADVKPMEVPSLVGLTNPLNWGASWGKALWARGPRTFKTSSRPCSGRTRPAGRRRSLRSPCAPRGKRTG